MDEFWKLMVELAIVAVCLWAVLLGGLYLGGGYAPTVLQGSNPTAAPGTASPAPSTTSLTASPAGAGTQTTTLTPSPTPTPNPTPPTSPTPTPTSTPTPRDSDGDGLADERERELGTDPSDRDTDGDTVPDGVEVRGETGDGVEYSDADPLRMDVYLVTYWSMDAHPPTNYENVTERFAAMPVENPDGTTGITLHVERAGLIDRPLVYDGSEESVETILSNVEAKPYHRHLVVVQFEDDRSLGVAPAPGRWVLINEQVSEEEAPIVVVHELLHNVLGEIDAAGACKGNPNHYCEGGYMEPVLIDRDYYLPEEIADEIEEEGFGP